MSDTELYNYAEDNDLPKLSDYDEIREFQDYELTQCIIYELAIRNPRYKKEVKYVMKFYSKYKTNIDYALQMKSSDIPREKMKHYGKLIEIQRYIANIETIPFDVHGTEISYRDTKTYGEDFYQLLDTIMQYNLKKYTNRRNKKKLINEINISTHEGFQVTTTIQSIDKSNFFIENKKKSLSFVRKYLDYDKSSIIRKRLHSKNVLVSQSIVHEKFKRPKLRFNNNTTKDVIVEIDLSRPNKEIYAYIKHLKKNLNDNNKIITPTELLASLFEPEDKVAIDNEEKFSADSKVDKFVEKLFIYDLIKEVQRKQQEYNNYLTEQSEYEYNHIRSMYTHKPEITKMLNKAKEEYLENIANSSASTYYEDKNLAKYLNVADSTPRNSYNAINKLIKGERYKNLNTTI